MNEVRASRRRNASKLGLTVFAACLAFLSVANLTAINNLPVPAFQLLGGGFFAAESPALISARQFVANNQQRLLHQVRPDIVAGDVPAPTAGRLRSQALAAIGFDAASSLGNTVGAFSALAENRNGVAARLMERSAALSKRDRIARYWMMQQALLRADFDGSLAQLDLMLRSTANPPPELFQQMVLLLQLPDGRRALAQVIHRNPNWLTALYESLVANSSNPTAIARLMIGSPIPLEDTERARAVYASLVEKLAAQGSGPELREIYGRLPGSQVEMLKTVAPSATSTIADYPPVTWKLAQDSRAGATIIAAESPKQGLLLDLLADTGHGGIVASKIFAPGSATLLVVVPDVVSRPETAEARLSITCVRPGAIPAQSGNLFDLSGQVVEIELPRGCPLARVDISIAAGTAGQEAHLMLGGLAVR